MSLPAWYSSLNGEPLSLMKNVFFKSGHRCSSISKHIEMTSSSAEALSRWNVATWVSNAPFRAWMPCPVMTEASIDPVRPSGYREPIRCSWASTWPSGNSAGLIWSGTVET